MFGMLMAPALTAPAISMEINRGTWDLLRVTPQSTRSILMAKLFGALARLRIWPLLFALSMLQGVLLAGAVTLGGRSVAIFGPIVGLAATVRPWLEVLFAGFAGMFLSTQVHSARVALASSYMVVIIFKLINSSVLWMGLFSFTEIGESLMLAGSLGPTFAYSLAIIGLWMGLMRQANKQNYE